jgi:hypothetical protein
MLLPNGSFGASICVSKRRPRSRLHPGGSFAKAGLEENAPADRESVGDWLLAVGSLQASIGNALISAAILAIEYRRIQTPLVVSGRFIDRPAERWLSVWRTTCDSRMVISFSIHTVGKFLDDDQGFPHYPERT